MYSKFSHSQISGGGGGLLLERAERPLYSQFSYSQISGGKWGKTGTLVGESQLYSVFFLHPKPHFSGGKILVADNDSRFSGGKGGKWVYDTRRYVRKRS